MKRYIELQDEYGKHKFLVDWMTCLKERDGGDIWIEWVYKIYNSTDSDKKDKEEIRFFERYIGSYGSKHKAIERIREFQEKIH